jgi:hypothetical protein
MRGYMRMVVDALELGDPVTLDDGIAHCEAFARQLGLPQYQWVAAAFRVMRATMRGEFAEAESALAAAEQLADRSQDPNASRTLAVQRLGLAEARERHSELAAFAKDLAASLVDMPITELFVRPTLLVIQEKLRRIGAINAPPVSIEPSYIDTVIQFRDPGAIGRLGELFVLLRDRPMAQRLYATLMPYRDRCGHWGLFGKTWDGPVARVLGLLAFSLDQPTEGEGHFAHARRIAIRMKAQPWKANIVISWAECLLQQPRPDTQQRALELLDEGEALARNLEVAGLIERVEACRARVARPSVSRTASVTVPVSLRLVKEGEVWVCECEGRTVRLQDSRGLQLLARLVADPDKDLHVLDLSGLPADGAGVDSGDSGELLDDRARREYQKRLQTLRADIEDAEEIGDCARAEAARAEIEQLSAELARAFGLGGSARRAGSATERARVNVQRRIKDAIRRIEKECPAAGRHLQWAVHTGTFCRYRTR